MSTCEEMLHLRAALVCRLSSRKRREVFGRNRRWARESSMQPVYAYVPSRLALHQKSGVSSLRGSVLATFGTCRQDPLIPVVSICNATCMSVSMGLETSVWRSKASI